MYPNFPNSLLNLSMKTGAQCAEEKSNESVEDMDGTFTGW